MLIYFNIFSLQGKTKNNFNRLKKYLFTGEDTFRELLYANGNFLGLAFK